MSRKRNEKSRKYAWIGRSLAGLWGETVFYHFCNLLGRGLSYTIIAIAVPFFVALRKPERMASFDFFSRVYGTCSRWRLFWHTYCQFWCWGACWIDRSIVFGNGGRRYTFTIKGTESFVEALEARKGIILLTAHIGNYGLGAWRLAKDYELAVNIAVIDDEERRVREFLDHIQGENRPRIINLSHTPFSSIPIVKALRGGEVVAIQADRVVDKYILSMDFFGFKALFPKGPFLISLISGAPILIVFILKCGWGRYTVVIDKVLFPLEKHSSIREEVIHDMAQQMVKRIEEVVRRHPHQWFNFYPYWVDSPRYHSPVEVEK